MDSETEDFIKAIVSFWAMFWLGVFGFALSRGSGAFLGLFVGIGTLSLIETNERIKRTLTFSFWCDYFVLFWTVTKYTAIAVVFEVVAYLIGRTAQWATRGALVSIPIIAFWWARTMAKVGGDD